MFTIEYRMEQQAKSQNGPERRRNVATCHKQAATLIIVAIDDLKSARTSPGHDDREPDTFADNDQNQESGRAARWTEHSGLSSTTMSSPETKEDSYAYQRMIGPPKSSFSCGDRPVEGTSAVSGSGNCRA